MRKNPKTESPPHARAAGRLSRMLKFAVGQTRDLARGLHPIEAEPTGLMSALEALARVRVSGFVPGRLRF